MKGKQINPNQLAGKIASLERQISQLNQGKQTAKPNKRKAERRGASNNPVLAMGVYANEFSSRYSMPVVNTKGDGTSRIRGREIISLVDVTFVTGIAAPVSVSKAIDFTIASSPAKWLYQYASLYDLYKFHSLKFTFQPTLSTVFSGNIAMYFDPGVAETASTTYVDLSANYGSVTASVHQPVSVTVNRETLNRLNWYAVKGGGSEDSNDMVGTLFAQTNSIAGVNNLAAGVITAGYIWMEYDAEFKNPTDPSH